jgi:hypothetical protein
MDRTIQTADVTTPGAERHRCLPFTKAKSEASRARATQRQYSPDNSRLR